MFILHDAIGQVVQNNQIKHKIINQLIKYIKI